MDPLFKKLVLPTAGTIYVFDIADIIRCESLGNYTRFYFRHDKPLLISKTLKESEELLAVHAFERIHNSHLINLFHLKKYIKTEECVIMSDGTSVPVSQRKKVHFLKVLAF